MDTTKFIPTRVLMFRSPRKHQTRGGTPAFPVRVGASDNAFLTAKLWVLSKNRWGYDRSPEMQRKVDAVTGVEIDNSPRKGFRLVDVETRSEGGRAWKVITPDGDLVDLREDVFIPILFDRGLPKGGLIDAEFQWCQNGSQLRLEEVGSTQHKTYLPENKVEGLRQVNKEAAKKRAKAAKATQIKKSDLRIGGIYEAPLYGRQVYLGEVDWQGRTYLAWTGLHYFEQKAYQDPLHDMMVFLSVSCTVQQCYGDLAAQIVQDALPTVRTHFSEIYSASKGTLATRHRIGRDRAWSIWQGCDPGDDLVWLTTDP